jgi:hypothetical protein
MSSGRSALALRRRPSAATATQLPLFAGEPVAELPQCDWRDCVEPATWSLGFGRNRDELLFADYCDDHAQTVGRMFRVEARMRRPPSPDFEPAQSRARARHPGGRSADVISGFDR